MQHKKISTQTLAYIALFTALIAALSQISIPMPLGLPMTLQTFIIPLYGVVLGAKLGTWAVLAYIMIGIIGLPVFSGGGSGIGWLFGPTGGFLIGFPFYAFFAGLGAKSKKVFPFIGGLLLGMLVTYTIGMLQFAWVTDQSIARAFTIVVLQFLPTELIKLVFVWILGRNLQRILARSGYLQ